MSNSSPPLLLLAALRMETEALGEALALPKHPSLPHAFAAPGILLLTIGLRACRLEKLRPAIDCFGPARVLLAGLGGALAPDLQIGDVLFDGPVEIRHARPGRIVMAREIIATPDAKAALRSATQADAVDMESDHVRSAFPTLPVTICRAVSDDSTMAVDPDVLSIVDDLGQPKPAKVAFLLARRPLLIPQLKRLQRDSNAALAALCKAVAAYADQSQSPPQPR